LILFSNISKIIEQAKLRYVNTALNSYNWVTSQLKINILCCLHPCVLCEDGYFSCLWQEKR